MDQGLFTDSGFGTPQGAVISPLMSNVYLHYVLDLWANRWRKDHAKGDMILVRLSANGSLVHVDDTTARLLSLITENQLNKENKKHRKGMYTTGILSKVDGHQVVLYFTGRKYSDENLSQLLEKRTLSEPISLMSDALSHNSPGENIKLLRFLCLTHARRNFIDIEDHFKEESSYVLGMIGQVYKNDDICKLEALSPEERLSYHQEHSAESMKDLKTWMEKSFDDKKVEPNSALGKAIKYMLKHWTGLTGFLRYPGAPLDNNILEQQLRNPVLNRKNWLFYKNSYGALVGDIILSVIKTCDLEGEIHWIIW